MEEFILKFQSLDPVLIYAVVFAIAFIENIFPPSPSDSIIVLGGSVAGLGRVGFAETLLFATLGSTAGFLVMYKIGEWFGDRILEQGKIKFIPVESVNKVEVWFRKYGYWIIVVNRFLSGTRAVISFFAGMSELNLLRTTIFCFVSALAWNAILIAGGFYLGKNWKLLDSYLSTYGYIVTAIVVVVALAWIAKILIQKKKHDESVKS